MPLLTVEAAILILPGILGDNILPIFRKTGGAPFACRKLLIRNL
jgi:hypothetical protein